MQEPVGGATSVDRAGVIVSKLRVSWVCERKRVSLYARARPSLRVPVAGECARVLASCVCHWWPPPPLGRACMALARIVRLARDPLLQCDMHVRGSGFALGASGCRRLPVGLSEFAPGGAARALRALFAVPSPFPAGH